MWGRSFDLLVINLNRSSRCRLTNKTKICSLNVITACVLRIKTFKYLGLFNPTLCLLFPQTQITIRVVVFTN